MNTGGRHPKRVATVVVAALLAGTLAAGAAFAQPECYGDCNEDGTVTIDEAIVIVSIMLNGESHHICPLRERPTIDDAVRAVGHALTGCTM